MVVTEYVFHVVCRDCNVESLVETETAAAELADAHAAESNHTVKFARVA
ncbi:hypothetical protein [Halogranum rubrum]|uniref:DUF1059 domain-containing protein n=1 Tax=Halogranum salarium B-1 TaxID=1210908 RepID=J3JHW8_9EURY|nr:hypothetical protein [Halogranum salarium]EJN61341.1 hypothetical protein HSB1_03820 [Halogranum salarium B-1]